ncbi:IclR family transcriptional regulator [Spongiactinospora sp. TRM90649]|uniref:IclR family transcriptional regulator n=1 Tax=Spongiactinospora sp. TRM90649 TaxID=3031114 RepID=UPI0023F8AE4C|nr:IclR family transcriptional regulator [Spongiactinospora sp. TRM90649]MDF5756383.1 IclR family transcriptional regulator [Spongiactinospora sp. TRM90649]
MTRTTARRTDVDDDRPASADYHTNALARGLFLLERLATKRATLTLTDFHQSTGLPKSTLVRLLGVLEEMGYVVRADERPAYRLGHKTLTLSTAYLSGLDLSQIAGDHLAGVAADTGQTANLGVLDGRQVLHVCVREPDRPIRFHTTAGTRDDTYCTGLGKMLLARLEPADITPHLPSEPFQPRTEHTHTTLDALTADLRAVAQRGYALDDNEGSVGLRCVAVPVEVDGVCVAAVSVSGPSAEFDDEQRTRYLDRLRAAASALASDADVVAALEYLHSSLRSGAPQVQENP